MPTLNMTVSFETKATPGDDQVAASYVAQEMLANGYPEGTLLDATWVDQDDPGPQLPDEEKDRDPAKPDREVEAIQACVSILLPLDPAQSAGVARYIGDRFTTGDFRS